MWNLKSHRLIYSLLFVFSVAFISLFGYSSDSYAVSDIIVNFDNTATSLMVCSNSDSNLPDCSDYNFLYIYTDWTWYGQSRNYRMRFDGSATFWDFTFYLFSPTLINISNYNLNYLRLQSTQSGIGTSDTYSGTLILSEINPISNCPICPEIPENPYDDKLDSIRNAIILVPAVCLLLYFFYVIFGIIIPTTGGKK